MPSTNPVTVTKHLDRLCRLGVIDPLIERVGRVLLWNCRAPRQDAAQVSLERLAELANVGLTKTKEAVARLVELGVIARQRTHQWIDGLRRQGRNVYRFLVPAPEVATRPTVSRQEKKTKHALNKALGTLRRALSGRGGGTSVEQQDREARTNRDRQLAALGY